ncbi:MAG: chemotaxis response regulator protein-glutamate methylesterase [Mariprofundaceae bacterium]
MNKIRVLVVDDAVLVRRMLSDVLNSDADIEVVGVAANGKIALEKIPRLEPDLITLDIEMPVMDGLETLVAIRKAYPRLPVIMFSTLSERGAKISLKALELGANDYVTKPTNTRSISDSQESLRTEFIPRIKALAGRPVRSSPLRSASARRAPVRSGKPGAGQSTLAKPASGTPVLARPQRRERVDILAIGTSTGGPNALAELIPAIPADFPVPVVIVQHMPPTFTRLLAERLDGKAALQVHEAAAGDKLEPGHVWLAPGGYHMVLERTGSGVEIRLNQDPAENSCRPAVDVLFRSVARLYGIHTLAAILTGMGQDGLLGCKDIVQAGGQVIAQDQASSVIWGMPGAVAEAELAEKLLPLNRIAGEFSQRLRLGRSR